MTRTTCDVCGRDTVEGKPSWLPDSVTGETYSDICTACIDQLANSFKATIERKARESRNGHTVPQGV